MRKTLVFIISLFISVIILSQYNEVHSYADVLNNKTLNYEKAINSGNIVMISFLDTISNTTNNDMEIYNIRRLDNFMENINNKKKDEIRIVEYGRNSTGTWVNKLYDLRYDGNKIVDIEYDTYSNPNEFIPSQPQIFKKIIKRDYSKGLSYRICDSDKDSDCGKLISFFKSSIVDSKR